MRYLSAYTQKLIEECDFSNFDFDTYYDYRRNRLLGFGGYARQGKNYKRNIQIANETFNTKQSLRELSKKWKLTPERIRQIAYKELRIYKHYFRDVIPLT